MKIWLVSIFENTPLDDNQNTRFNAIVKEAVNRGHKVTYWASTFKHNVKSQRYSETTTKTVTDRLTVHYVKSKGYRSNISFKRLLSHGKLADEMIIEMNKSGEQPDIIMMAFPPISLVYNVTKWAKKRGVPVITDIIDPWPDSFRRKMKFLPGKVQDAMLASTSKKTSYIFSNSEAVTGIAEQRLVWAKKYSKNLKRTEYFYPAVNLKEMQEALSRLMPANDASDSKLRVIYAGSLESSYDIPTILAAAEILEQKYSEEIEFIIAGAGYQKELIEEYTASHSNLRYIGRVPKDELMKEYARADLGLIQHHKNATQTVTYKLFDLLGSGLPVMNSLESELNDILLENRVGLFNNPGNAAELAENIEYCHQNRVELMKMKKRAVTTTEKLGDAAVVYSEVVDLIEECAEVHTIPV